MPQNTKKPQLRFKGFTDDWEQRKLGEIYNFEYGQFNNNPNNGGPYPVFGANGIIGFYSNYNAINSIIIGHMGEYAGSVLWGEGKHFVTYNGTITVPKEKNILPKYGYYMLLRSNIRKTCGGSGLPFLSYEMLQKLNVFYAKNIDEQLYIKKLFESLDNLITLQQRKLDKLKNIKKSMLEKIFPQNGSNIPEIRFKGFTDAWEQRNTKELCSISTGKSNTQDRVEDGKYPFYVRSSIVERSNRYLFDEEAVLTVGDGVGTGKVFHYVNGKYDLHQRVYRMFNFSEEISAKYFFYYFSNHFYNRVMAMTAKTSVDSVRYEMISEMEIYLPNKQEQNIIAMYFESLDNLITLHQRKLEKLQNIKKACLEKMFV